MKTLTHRFNQAVKQLKNDLDFTDCETDPTMIVEILEPSCNMDFVTVITKIAKDGKIYSKQFEDSPEEDWFCNDISDLMSSSSKEKVCELVEDSIMKTYTIDKQEGTFYVDYFTKDNKCYIVEEFYNKVKTTFVCNTKKDRCDDLQETQTQILITI